MCYISFVFMLLTQDRSASHKIILSLVWPECSLFLIWSIKFNKTLFSIKTHFGQNPTTHKHFQEMVCVSIEWQGTPQPGWAWHREPNHLADTNCDVRCCLGRGPLHSGPGGIEKVPTVSWTKGTQLHRSPSTSLFTSSVQRGWTLLMPWNTHTNSHTHTHRCRSVCVCVCVAGDRWGMKLSDPCLAVL